jgi:hypothetical protein
MGLLDHENTYPCPHGGCDGQIVIRKGNITGSIKGIEHRD